MERRNQLAPEEGGARAAVAFDYQHSGVPKSVAVELKNWAAEIRDLQSSAVASMLKIGKLLEAARRTLRPPIYKAWLEAELHIRYSTAANYISAYSAFPKLPASVAAKFDPSGLIELSRGRVAPAAREKAVAMAKAGTPITLSKALGLADDSRQPGEASQVELDGRYRLRSALRHVAHRWRGEGCELARYVLEVVREVLAEGADGELDAEAAGELDKTALALGVPIGRMKAEG
ncbi:MAG TPA: hypothetical protein VND64_07845 [Pirellulales bacterium]|nr:hypothetical protein [Pirellulales bacterium]